MKLLNISSTLLALCSVVACTGTDTNNVSSNIYNAFNNASNKTGANISHEDGWTIVSTTEKKDRVYWFLAPDIDKVSPAIFKKTVRAPDTKGQETVIVSQCDAPRQTCDELMKQFSVLSDKYK